ncbi:MAG: Na/Pi cotransporter family protein [Clostridia bacterium]|nr:Na/Pi cotransporter family protein [Clostridia bacterium]
MDIFSLLTVLGGVALFLYGMRVMGNGLEKLSGGKLEKFLERVTSSRLLGVLLGAAVTAVLQSSSATTVTVVGFVNAGIMKLSQAVGIIMGANVGTTVTGWILTLSTLPGNSIWEDIFRATTFTPVIAVIGILFIMAGKKDRQKDVGTIMLGFAVLMFAMHSISEAVSPLREDPVFTRAIGFFSNPLLGILVGIVITTVLQSSSASVGILQALSVTGSITYGTVLPVIMGMNIGASVPALLSSMGAKVEAKRAAFIYLYFNVLGTVICLPLYYLLDYIFSRTAVGGIGAAAATSVGIALVNTVIKVVATLILLPFSNLLCKLAEVTIRDKRSIGGGILLEERFLKTPGVAIEQSRRAAADMANKARKALFLSLECVDEFDRHKDEEIKRLEDEVDLYEDKLGTYLVKLSSADLTLSAGNETVKLLHAIGDFERISDHACNISESAEEIDDKEITFSAPAKADLKVITDALRQIVNMTFDAFERDDAVAAREVEPLEQVIDDLKESIKLRHVERLVAGECTIEMGFVFADLLTSFERISDHCSNIAVALLQIRDASFETHSSLNVIKKGGAEFLAAYEKYSSRYRLSDEVLPEKKNAAQTAES